MISLLAKHAEPNDYLLNFNISVNLQNPSANKLTLIVEKKVYFTSFLSTTGPVSNWTMVNYTI